MFLEEVFNFYESPSVFKALLRQVFGLDLRRHPCETAEQPLGRLLRARILYTYII